MPTAQCCNASRLVEIFAAPQHNRASICEEKAMSEERANDLIRFLGESAQELTARAVLASSDTASGLIAEAEELMALRSKLLQRLWDAELSAQLPLHLSTQEAA
jgi:hypothetical protein